jgi:hypothetical protein
MPESKLSALFTTIYNFTIFYRYFWCEQKGAGSFTCDRHPPQICQYTQAWGIVTQGLITVFFLDQLCDRPNKKAVWGAVTFLKISFLKTMD